VTSTVAPGERHHSFSPQDSSCQNPDYTAIQPAIEASNVGGTVVVCAGTYPGMVNVDKKITLAGRDGAIIDATGSAYGIGVSASWSTIVGMTVMNASPLTPPNSPADGIITAALTASGPVAANHVNILHNTVTGNLGSGIDVNSSSWNVVSYNKADHNGVGINVSDDLNQPANHNTITYNNASDNPGGCGIVLADHTGAGVSWNWVAHNVADGNGLGTPTAQGATAGSGLILASPIPNAIVTNNTVTRNEFHGNGLGGVDIHAHVAGSNFSDNAITNNFIGTNNTVGDENDPQTTGIYLGSVDSLSVKVRGNFITDNYYGIFTSGPVTVHRVRANHFVGVTHKLGTFPTF
jgi:parallel beta-helix repeat protein